MLCVRKNILNLQDKVYFKIPFIEIHLEEIAFQWRHHHETITWSWIWLYLVINFLWNKNILDKNWFYLMIDQDSILLSMLSYYGILLYNFFVWQCWIMCSRRLFTIIYKRATIFVKTIIYNSTGWWLLDRKKWPVYPTKIFFLLVYDKNWRKMEWNCGRHHIMLIIKPMIVYFR